MPRNFSRVVSGGVLSGRMVMNTQGSDGSEGLSIS